MREPIKWWSAVPVGATLTQLDTMSGEATFEYDNHGNKVIVMVDLFTDEVTHIFTSI